MVAGFASGTGYPDFERVTTLVTDPLVYEVINPVLATQSYGPFYVGTFPTLIVSADPAVSATAQYQVFLQWFADEALADQVGNFVWSPDNEYPLHDAIANVGPWVKVTVFNPSAPNALTLILSVVATVAAPRDCRPFTSKVLAEQAPITVGAGTTTSVKLAAVTTGEVLMYAEASASGCKSALNVYLGNTVQYAIAQIDSGSSQQGEPVRVFLPERPVRLDLDNPTGSAVIMSGAVVLP